MKRGLMIIGMMLLWGCGYDEFGVYEPIPKEELLPNIILQEVRDLYRGEPVTVNGDVIMGGYVTANDQTDNFYRTFIIQDPAGGAIEVKAGLYSLYTTFVEGRYVAIRAEGLTVDEYNGVLQIGMTPVESGLHQPEYFDHRVVMEKFVCPGSSRRKITPRPVRCLELLSEDWCGELVRLDSVQLAVDTVVTWAIPATVDTRPQTAYRVFLDRNGQSVAVVTSGYADFARDTVPRTEVSLTGILMHGKIDTGKTMFLLKMRSRDDVALY